MLRLSNVCCRYKQGKPLSCLDGVPYAVIDGIDALPYGTTAGTTFVSALSFFPLSPFKDIMRKRQLLYCASGKRADVHPHAFKIALWQLRRCRGTGRPQAACPAIGA